MSRFIRSISDVFRKDRDRWVLWIPVGLAVGIGIYFLIPWEPVAWTGGASVILCLAIRWTVIKVPLIGGGQAIERGALVIGVIALGFTAAQFRTYHVASPVLGAPISFASLSGRIVQVEHFPSGPRITLERPQISKVAPYLAPTQVRVRLRGKQPKLEPGDWIQGRVGLAPPGPPALPGGFDFQRHSYFQKIGAYGYSLGSVRILAKSTDSMGLSLKLWIASLRDHLTERVINGLKAPLGGIAAALMTGEKHAVAEPIVENLRRSGLAHLLAISGLHIGLIAGLVFSGVRLMLVVIPGLAVSWPVKKWAAVAAIGAAFCYAVVAGATLPTQRAFLMAAIALLAVVWDRRGISLRSVAWAATLVLLIQPESLLGPSFQMSFAAAAALVACYEFWKDKRRNRIKGGHQPGPSTPLKKAISYVGGVSLTTLVASAATAPFSLYHFNQFAEYSLFANLIAVPLTALWIMPWAVVTFLVMPFGLESWALQPMGWGISGVIAIAEYVSNWPGAVVRLPAIPTWGLVLVALSGSWLFIWRYRWRLLALPFLLIGVVSFQFTGEPDILVDGQGRLFAFRGNDGTLQFSDLRKAKRDRELWLRQLGKEKASLIKMRPSGDPARHRITCDSRGCLYSKFGLTVAVTDSESALAEDCWIADMVVSLVPIRQKCPALHQIDRFDLWRNGTYAISITQKGFQVRYANQSRGERPWVLVPGPSQSTAAPQPGT